MRKFVTVASIVVLAASAASCGSSQQGSNSAGNILPADSLVGPSALEARSPSGGGGKGGGKGGGGTTSGGGGGSLSLVMYADQNGNGLPNWGDTVTFNVSTTATTTPNVELKCFQNGSVVYGATAGFYDGYPWPWTKNMNLSSGAWTGGAANCTAELYYGVNHTVLATLSFNVAA
jgi:hypothetical protein